MVRSEQHSLEHNALLNTARAQAQRQTPVSTMRQTARTRYAFRALLCPDRRYKVEPTQAKVWVVTHKRKDGDKSNFNSAGAMINLSQVPNKFVKAPPYVRIRHMSRIGCAVSQQVVRCSCSTWPGDVERLFLHGAQGHVKGNTATPCFCSVNAV